MEEIVSHLEDAITFLSSLKSRCSEKRFEIDDVKCFDEDNNLAKFIEN